ncbi:MAG TPA: hypothetical protein VEB68_07350 [Croceibacterium sp.]|nr:hypothetical protein [Croceibacterium sp.]
MTRRSPLDDPANAAHAWARYKRLLKGMGVFTAVVVVVTLAGFYALGGDVPIHFFIATALGIGFMMMLAAALMGLVFLSSGTGHDESVSDATDQSRSGRNR